MAGGFCACQKIKERRMRMKKGRDQARVGLDEKMRKFSYISGMKG